jgi:catechol-2,3-dioxygenase
VPIIALLEQLVISSFTALEDVRSFYKNVLQIEEIRKKDQQQYCLQRVSLFV